MVDVTMRKMPTVASFFWQPRKRYHLFNRLIREAP